MEVGKLTVKRRHGSGKGVARKLRVQGMIPGICYGFGIDQPVPLAVDTRALKACLDPIKRQNTVIEMTVEDGDQVERNVTVMVKDYQIQKIRRDLLHVDLISIDRERVIEAEVPIEFTGSAIGLVEGGKLHAVRRTIEVRSKPADIPANVLLDISALDVGGVLHVSDLALPESVECITPERLTIITCTAGEVEVVETDEAVEGGEEVAPTAEK